MSITREYCLSLYASRRWCGLLFHFLLFTLSSSYLQAENQYLSHKILPTPKILPPHSQSLDYEYNSHVPLELWERLKPYFLPLNHPIKNRLDRICKKNRVTLSRKTLQKAGFSLSHERKPENITVCTHSRFPGFLFKVYVDTQPPIDEWENWVRRIDGANAIQKNIDAHHFVHCCVPKKWIYPLPQAPSPPIQSMYHRKNFILIAEKMDILDKKANRTAFRQTMTSTILDELFVIITEEGLIDSVYPSNIPFTHSGQIAFVDTEHRYPDKKVNYGKLTSFLSETMQEYWNRIILND